jgi:sigma-B regulation protein RsbU (phosphoserine phosphatase)
LALTLGDVSGKGIPAAVMMASIQILLRSMLQQEKIDIPEILQELNRVLYASSMANSYSTLFCAVFNSATGELAYVNAGHVPPLLRRVDGRLVTLPGGGLPVGLLPSCTYDLEKVNLQSGDSVLIISDGFVEVCNFSGDFWDEARVAEIFARHGSAPIADLPAALTAEADAWAAGAEQFDDMTIVALRIA